MRPVRGAPGAAAVLALVLVLSASAGCVSAGEGHPGDAAIRGAADRAVEDALDRVAETGEPLSDSREFLSERVRRDLRDRGYAVSRVEVGESTEQGYNPPFRFYVAVDSGLPVWIEVEGRRDPLHLLRGVEREIRPVPFDDYGEEVPGRVDEVMEDGHFFESSDGAPFLDRLEGDVETEAYGFETFVRKDPLDRGDVSMVDHYYWRTSRAADEVAPGLWLDRNHAKKYGFR